MSILIYDCEIIKAIPSKEKLPNIEYCEGWHDFENMGISVIGTWVYWDDDFHGYQAFSNQQFDQFQQTVDQNDLIIGFNSIAFDDKLCRANGIKIETNFDLLVEIRKATDQGDGFYDPEVTREGYSLEKIATANLPFTKSMTGEQAAIAWQQGKHKQVVDYCLLDVEILKELYFKFINNELKDPTNRELILYK